MLNDAIAATKLSDVLKPQTAGEPVNAHVVQSPREPEPDFAEMRRIVAGREPEQSEPREQREPAD